MIYKTSDNLPTSKWVLIRVASVAVVALLSGAMVSVPAHANDGGLTITPAQPVFELGGPSPAMVITTGNITMPSQIGRFRIKMASGSRVNWDVGNDCQGTWDQSTTRADRLTACKVLSVKVTEQQSGQQAVVTDLTSAVQVSKNIGQIEIVFDTQLPSTQNTRTIEVSIGQGAFIVSPWSTTVDVTLTFTSNPVQQGGGTVSSLASKSYSEYASVSFDGGPGSAGTMGAIFTTMSSNLPANTFTRSGFSFSGWSCSQGGEVAYADQAVMARIDRCPTLYAVWTAPGSGTTPSGSATTSAGSTVSSVPTTKAASLATTGTSLSSWAPGLVLALGWILVAYSRTLRAPRARHLKI